MENNINIEDYKDYKNISIAEYVVAKSMVEKSFIDALKHMKIKTALKYAGLYIELDKLSSKRYSYIEKQGKNTSKNK